MTKIEYIFQQWKRYAREVPNDEDLLDLISATMAGANEEIHRLMEDLHHSPDASPREILEVALGRLEMMWEEIPPPNEGAPTDDLPTPRPTTQPDRAGATQARGGPNLAQWAIDTPPWAFGLGDQLGVQTIAPGLFGFGEPTPEQRGPDQAGGNRPAQPGPDQDDPTGGPF